MFCYPSLWRLLGFLIPRYLPLGLLLTSIAGESHGGVCVSDSYGMVSWWCAEGDATDSVDRGRASAAHSVRYAAGKVGNAFDFDGTAAYIEIPDSADLRLTNALTVEGWIYPRAPGQRYQEIVSKWSDGYSYTLTLCPSGKAAFSVCSDGIASFGTVESHTAITAKAWTHLAVTYDGSSLKMYVNGQFHQSTPWSNDIHSSRAPVSIGTSLTAPSFFDGLIDELSLYGKPLGEDDLRFIFQQGQQGKCTSTNAQISVVVNGALVTSNAITCRGPATVALTPTTMSDLILYTLDGKDPAASGILYGGPIRVIKSGILRAVGFNADLVQSSTRDAMVIEVLPFLETGTPGGGDVGVYPVSGAYLENNMVQVTAKPQTGWVFLEWRGDASGTNPVISIQMNRDKRISAVFGTTLNAQVIGSGTIDVCPASLYHPYGSSLRLTGVPADGGYFAFWGNQGNGDTRNPITVSLTQTNPTFTAVFSSLGASKSNSVTILADGLGQVALTPDGTKFRNGQTITVLANPNAGQEFLHWAGAASGSDNPLSLQVQSNLVLKAVFSRRPSLLGSSIEVLLAAEGFRFGIVGCEGDVYELLLSTNLVDWAPLGSVTNQWGSTQFTDLSGTNATQGYYRAQLKSDRN